VTAAPSRALGLTTWSVYETDAPGDADALRALSGELFAVAVGEAEWVRELRRSAARPEMVCANVCLRWTAEDRWHRAVLTWPHWVVKCLYSPVGVMIGKFWRGETDADRYHCPIPSPPVTFLSVRSAIRRRDPRFLSGTPTQAAAIAVSHDDGRDVFAAIPGLPGNAVTDGLISAHWPDLCAWSAGSLPDRRLQSDPKLTP